MRILTWKISAVAVALGLSVFGSSCSKSKHNASPGVSQGEEAAQPDGEEAPANTEDAAPTEEDYTAAYSVLNFRQLAAAYEKATGVPLQGAVLAEYENQLNSLPKDPDPTAVAASQVS
ncbi:MAG: hypothetical protein ACOH5I_14460, partial [Oligoflexus sp.]